MRRLLCRASMCLTLLALSLAPYIGEARGLAATARGHGVQPAVVMTRSVYLDRARGPALVSRLGSHGVRITLTVPHRQYPRNALIQVALTVKNVSRHTIDIRSGLQAPVAFVTNSSGAEVFDPVDPLGENALFALTGPGPRSESLPRGRIWGVRPYLVLRGNRLSYSVLLGKVGGGITRIMGRPISVSLTGEPAPQISITTVPALQAAVIPSEPISGPMFYVGQTSCVTSTGTYSTGDGWTAMGQTVVRPRFIEGPSSFPGCAAKRIWHALIGWLNHPVAVLSYDDASRTVAHSH